MQDETELESKEFKQALKVVEKAYCAAIEKRIQETKKVTSLGHTVLQSLCYDTG